MDKVDGKPAAKLRNIGEASAELGIKTHILRYWEVQFDALMPLKRAGGRRYYRAEDMVLLREIDRLLNRDGYTIKGAQNYLKNRSKAAISGDISNMAQDFADMPIEQLTQIRDSLAAAIEKVRN